MIESVKYAIIADDNETVLRVNKWVPGRQPVGAVRVTEATGVAGPGFSWDGVMFTAPPAPEPPAEDRATKIKRECERTIKAILDDNTVKNLLGNMVLGRLSQSESNTFAKGQTWVDDMIAECRRAIVDGDHPTWPAVPDGLVALAENY